MGTMKGVLKGKKISNRHSTFLNGAAPIIEAAKGLDEVKKVVISEIVHLGGGPRRLKVVAIPAGLRVVVRMANAQQTLYVYTSAPDLVERALRDVWEANFP